MKSDGKDRSKTRKPKVRIQFGRATKYPRKGARYLNSRELDRAAFDPQDPNEFDEILGNFGDWGSQ